ncbi:DUF4050 family protein [Senna tora]|uniref:DUF4050 family protein n=1 Tax=Senna tora TaxID=362788 RepID=A0A834W6Z5_9FABA|nr:DUF4050 family protein [Senna tora]
MSDNFWSSSTCDLDNSTIQSQRSISSVSTLNQLFYHSSEASTAGTHHEFINQGKFYVSLFFSVCLLHWKESRIQWIGNSRPKKQNQQKRDPKLNSNATYESLLGTREPFPESIPLSDEDKAKILYNFHCLILGNFGLSSPNEH